MTRDPAALATLRHELRTPLNHIIGYSEMLLEDGEAGLASALAPDLRKILEEARRLLGMINDLLAPARIEAGGVDPERLPSELAVPLREIIERGDAGPRPGDRAGADRRADPGGRPGCHPGRRRQRGQPRDARAPAGPPGL